MSLMILQPYESSFLMAAVALTTELKRDKENQM